MTLDLSSLFHTTIGFDDIANILNNFANSEQTNTYPPYNISKINDTTYRISIALAGFETNDIDIILEKDILTIKSSGKEKNLSENFLYKGIAFRAFERKFQLADVLKTHGDNRKVKKFIKFHNFTEIKIGLSKVIKWVIKNGNILKKI